MNAGELVISLLLSAGSFRQDLAGAQDSLDNLGEAGASAMDAITDAANQMGDSVAHNARSGAGGVDAVSDAARGARDEIERVSQSAGRAGNSLEDMAKRAEEGMRNLKSMAQKLAGFVGVGLSVKSMVSDYLAQADALGKYSDALNLNVEEVQAWTEAIGHAGGNGEAFKATLENLTANLTQAAELGTGRMLPFLKELGISVKDASGKTKSALDLLPELAEKFEEMSAEDASGFGRKLGLDKGTIMLLQQGRKATEEAVKAGKEHIKFTKEDMQAAANANDAIQDMQTAFVSLAMRAIAPLIPLMTKAANVLHDFAQWCSQNQEAVTAFFIALAIVLSGRAIPAMLQFAKATWTAMAPLLPLIAAAAALGFALDELWAFATGGDSILERLMRRFGMTQEQIEAVRNAVRNVIGVFLDLWDVLTGDEATAEAAWNRLKQTWEEAKEYFAKIKAWLLDLLPDWVKKIIGGGGSEEGEKTHKAAANGDPEAQAYFTQLQEANGMPSPGLLSKGSNETTIDNSKDIDQTFNINQTINAAPGMSEQGIADQSTAAIRNMAAQTDGAY